MSSAPDIISACARSYAVGEDDIFAHGRAANVRSARRAAYWLLRNLPPPGRNRRTYKEVAVALRRTHPSATQAALQHAEAQLIRDAGFIERVAQAGSLLAGKAPS